MIKLRNFLYIYLILLGLYLLDHAYNYGTLSGFFNEFAILVPLVAGESTLIFILLYGAFLLVNRHEGTEEPREALVIEDEAAAASLRKRKLIISVLVILIPFVFLSVTFTGESSLVLMGLIPLGMVLVLLFKFLYKFLASTYSKIAILLIFVIFSSSFYFFITTEKYITTQGCIEASNARRRFEPTNNCLQRVAMKANKIQDCLVSNFSTCVAHLYKDKYNNLPPSVQPCFEITENSDYLQDTTLYTYPNGLTHDDVERLKVRCILIAARESNTPELCDAIKEVGKRELEYVLIPKKNKEILEGVEHCKSTNPFFATNCDSVETVKKRVIDDSLIPETNEQISRQFESCSKMYDAKYDNITRTGIN